MKEKYNSSTWGIEFSSRGEDNENFILLWLGRTVYSFYFDWFFLKPYKYDWTYQGKVHKMIAAKQFGIVVTFEEGSSYVTIDYGADADFLMGNRKDRSNVKHIPAFNKIWLIPWLNNTFAGHFLLNIDGSVFYKMDNKKEECSWDYLGHERFQFTFVDPHDGDEILATVRREKRVWTRGIGWMKWIKYFTKPIVNDDLYIEFDKEVGSGKGSHRGGITGDHVEIKNEESVEKAIVKHCEENGYLFIGRVSRRDGKYVYKNFDKGEKRSVSSNLKSSQ